MMARRLDRRRARQIGGQSTRGAHDAGKGVRVLVGRREANDELLVVRHHRRERSFALFPTAVEGQCVVRLISARRAVHVLVSGRHGEKYVLGRLPRQILAAARDHDLSDV